jgi:hypothetical protein
VRESVAGPFIRALGPQISELAEMTRQYDIAPIFLPGGLDSQSNDPVCLAFGRLVDRVVHSLTLLSELQVARLIEWLEHDCGAFFESRRSSRNQELAAIAECIVVLLVSPEHSDISPAIVTDPRQDRVLSEYPELKGCFDDDGLLMINKKFEPRHCGIAYKKHILQFHQFLRREFLSSVNSDLINELYSVTSSNSSVRLRIAIDRTRLMPRDSYREVIERDYWWGPKFDESRLDDPTFVGETVIARGPGTVLERLGRGGRFFAPVERTQFFWAMQRGIKKLEIEEICQSDAALQGFFLQRYVHAERDIRAKQFRHLDGAVKVYSPAQFDQRREMKLSERPRGTAKPKVFRLDGPMTTAQAVGVICHFYRSNEMVIEYFNKNEF